jgi:hypothetical protein
MTEAHITITGKHWAEAVRQLGGYSNLAICNKAIEIALAEQQESEYITAEQARELGAGNAEFQYQGETKWRACNSDCRYNADPSIKYRAIKQAQPEPVDPDDVRIELVVALNSLASDFEIATYSMQKGSEDRVKAEGAIAHAMKIHAKHNQNGRIFTNKPEPVDPHAALRAEYDKQVKEGTLGFYLWEHYSEPDRLGWLRTEEPNFIAAYQYRYTDISCYVAKQGEPAKRMLRSEAKELQRKLGDTVEWFTPFGNTESSIGEPIMFDRCGVFTYRTKATIKLDGRMVTPEQAAAEWEAKKETHERFVKWGNKDFLELTIAVDFISFNDEEKFEYELRPKALKQVNWSDMPVGVAVRCNDTDYVWILQGVYVWILQGVGDNKEALITVPNNKSFGMRWIDCRDLTLAPASAQPWIAVQRNEDGVAIREKAVTTGLCIELHHTREKYKITGIAKGYVLGGAV